MLVVSCGFDPEWAMDLPVPRFSDLVESVTRVRYREKVLDAWTAAHAAQADGEGFANFVTENLEPLTGRAPAKSKKKKSRPKSI